MSDDDGPAARLGRRVPGLLTPAGARAVTWPGAIVAAGAGAALMIAAGAGGVAAAAVGAVAYAGTVAARIPRRLRAPRLDVASLPESWRVFVTEALDARRRYGQATTRAAAGPLRERLRAIGDQIEQAVQESWRIARYGADLEAALRQLDPVSQVERRLARVEAELAAGGQSRPHTSDHDLKATADALRSQLASIERLTTLARHTRDRLELLDARLDEAVARAVELSLNAADAGAAQRLGSDVEGIVTEMEALRLALEETRGTPAA